MFESAADAPLFAAMPERARSAVVALMMERTHSPGDVLLRQGDRSGDVFVLLSGAARVQRELPTGGTVELVTLPAGATLGLLAALDGGVRAASVIVNSESRVAVLPKEAFDGLMEGRNHVALGFQIAVLRRLSDDLTAANSRLVELASLPDETMSLQALTDVVYGSP